MKQKLKELPEEVDRPMITVRIASPLAVIYRPSTQDTSEEAG